jgi:acetyl esterase
MMALPELPQLPESLIQTMATIGPIWGRDTRGHIKLMTDLFSEILRRSPKQHAEVRRNIPYGSHERQCFDLFLPKEPQRLRPALIFVHGGAFTEGSRNKSEEIYSNVLYYFSRYGVVGINAGYRLAPDAKYPEATRDIENIVSWTYDRCDELSIDKRRIFLMGHSAGGAHAASYAYDKRLHPQEGPGLAGLIIVSGRVRADNRPENPNAKRVEAYYGTESAAFEKSSPVAHVARDSVDTFIGFSEFENPFIDVYCLELAYRIAQAKGRAPQLAWLPKHNHTSIIAHFNTAEDLLGAAIRRFMKLP